MQAGRLRHRATLQQRTAASPNRTASGAPDEAWTTVATVYCAIEPLRGKEFLEAQQVQSSVAVRIRMRYRPSVTAGMRVVHEGAVYSIEAVIHPSLKKEELQLMCSQGTNNG